MLKFTDCAHFYGEGMCEKKKRKGLDPKLWGLPLCHILDTQQRHNLDPRDASVFCEDFKLRDGET